MLFCNRNKPFPAARLQRIQEGLNSSLGFVPTATCLQSQSQDVCVPDQSVSVGHWLGFFVGRLVLWTPDCSWTVCDAHREQDFRPHTDGKECSASLSRFVCPCVSVSLSVSVFLILSASSPPPPPPYTHHPFALTFSRFWRGMRTSVYFL